MTLTPNKTIQLRPYQRQAINAVAGHFLTDPSRQVKRQLVVAPTGAGKTIIIASLLAHDAILSWLDTYPVSHRKILFVAHRDELLQQAADKIQKVNPHLYIDIEKADRHASEMADVVVASVQTIAPRGVKRMGKWDAEQWRLVICDEAHHASADSYQRVWQYLGLTPPEDFMPAKACFDHSASNADLLKFQRTRLEAWDKISRDDTLLLGITATPNRADNVGLESVFQKIIYQATMLDLMQPDETGQTYLSRLRAIRVESKTSLESVRTKLGDFDQADLALAIDNDERNKLAVKAYLEHASDRRAIAFCVNVQHGVDLAKAFNDAGVNATSVSGTTPLEERRAILRDFAAGNTRVLSNCAILVEGFDDPSVDCIIHARPTKSSLMYQQMSGRGVRLAPGKKDCLIIDIVDITGRHQLITAPSLVGLPSMFGVDGDLLEAKKEIEGLKAKNPTISLEGAKTLAEMRLLVTEVDLFKSAIAAPEVREHSKLTWIRDDATHYWMEVDGDRSKGQHGSRINVVQNAMGLWDITQKMDWIEFNETQRRTIRHLSDNSLFDNLDSLATALKTADGWLMQNMEMSLAFKKAAAPWRKEKATEGQWKYITWLAKKLRTQVPKSELTKGEAASLIELWRKQAKLAV